MPHKKPVRIYLWQSMCAVYPTIYHVKGFRTGLDLLNDYLSKQRRKMRRVRFVDYCMRNPNTALHTAGNVLKLRRNPPKLDDGFDEMKYEVIEG